MLMDIYIISTFCKESKSKSHLLVHTHNSLLGSKPRPALPDPAPAANCFQQDCTNFHSQLQCMNFLWIHFPSTLQIQI